MRRYESYKDSGVEWLGKVPSHWEILSIRRLSQVKRGASPRPIDNPKYFDDDGEYAWVRISDVTASNMYLLETTQKLSNLGKSYSVPLMPGSLFLSIAGSVGKPIITKIKVCIHDGFVYFPEYKQNTKFLYYIFYSEQPYIGLGKMGTQLNLNTDTVGAIKIPIPPLSEQQKIAQFLDDKTAKIDQAVDLAEKQIALLKEHKQIMIQNAVTRGLNPDVPLKDSGVEWIGQVPEHWEVKKLKFVSKINQHTLPENTNGSLSIKYVDIGSVSFENGIEKVENFSFKNAPSRARRLANRGDIVVSTVRTYLKAITMVKEEHQDCIFSTGFAVITSNKCLEDNFFELYAKSDAFTEQVSVFSKGMSYPAINSTDLSNLWITVPPISEQQKIADYLEIQVSKINQAIALKTAHIEKLKEYKSVLINDVVTGKVRVSV